MTRCPALHERESWDKALGRWAPDPYQCELPEGHPDRHQHGGDLWPDAASWLPEHGSSGEQWDALSRIVSSQPHD